MENEPIDSTIGGISQQNSDPCKKKRLFTWKQKAALVLPVNAFLALSVLFFAPMEIYLGNINEFAFPLNHVWWILLLACAVLTVGGGLLEFILPDRAFLAANVAVFALGLCCYIQSLALNGKMSSLTGEEENTFGTGLVIGNLLIWVFIATAVVVFAVLLAKKKSVKTVASILEFISLAAVAMQTVAFVSLLVTADTSSFQKSDYLTTTGEFELSGKNNVIVFVLDTCDGSYIDRTLERYPDLMNDLHGFTYYPNSMSTHSRTYPSITYLLTRELCYFDTPYADYIDKAFANSDFLPAIYDAGADIRIFTENAFIGSSFKDKVSNSSSYLQSDLSILSIPDLLKQMLKISLYREMPYAAKPRFQYEIAAINNRICNLPDAFVQGDDPLFFQNLRENGITINQKFDSAFRFYHTRGAHGSFIMDENGMPAEGTDMETCVKGNFHIIEQYIQEMQQLGIYEDSTIIITTDHGLSEAISYENLSMQTAPSSLLLVKEAGKGMEDPLQVSNAPVGHIDLFPTIWAAYGLDYSKYGRPVYEIGEDEQRDRYYYFSAFVDDNDGEIVLREYLVQGDAREIENAKLTGRYWDINYSQRSVSKKRFAELPQIHG